jgi:hypothetical protein
MRPADGSWLPVFGLIIAMDALTAILAPRRVQADAPAWLHASNAAPAGALSAGD